MKDLGLFSFKKRRLKNDLITDFKIMRVIKPCMVTSCLVSGEIRETRIGFN